MKIAFPTKADSTIDDHFGHCAFFSVVTVENGSVSEVVTLPAPVGCGCKSGIATTLSEMGVSVLIAGNMGEGAKKVLEARGIRVIRGCGGNVDKVVRDFISGKVSDSGQGCKMNHGRCEEVSEYSINISKH